MPAPSLSTPAARIELRDLVTSIWHELSEIGETDGPSFNRTAEGRACIVAFKVSALGFLVAVDVRDGASSPVTITVTACDGSSVTLDWEPSVYGFDYPTSGDDACDLGEIEAQHEREPDTMRDAAGLGVYLADARIVCNNTARCDGCGVETDSDPVPSTTAGDECPRRFCPNCC